MARSTAFQAIAGIVLAFCSVARASPDQTLCNTIKLKLGNGTVEATDGIYEALSTENWSQTVWAKPACIIQPSNTKELTYVVSTVVGQKAKFAVRSGGHSVVKGAANIDGGVLIDMARFDSVEYDANKKVATVGSGLRWKEVYTALDPYNVTVVGGRVLEVGVGGLVLGGEFDSPIISAMLNEPLTSAIGGLSYLADLYGLVCDNVVNFEVVTAKGTVVNASATSHPDLFWALKGGANNFGIVTKFTLKAYDIHDAWGGVRVYSLDALPALFDAMYEYQSVANKDPYANIMLQAFPTNASIGAILNVVYLKPEEEPEAFAPFRNITPLADLTKLQTLTELMLAAPVPELTRVNWFSSSFATDKQLFGEVADILTKAPELEELANLTAGSLAFGWQPISSSAVLAGHSSGGNPLGLQPVNQTWLVLDVGWWKPEDDELAHNYTLSMINKIDDASKSSGNYVDYIFMNDAAADQPVIEHYGQENVAKLKATAQKYDPDQVFQNLASGGFKLP
ncbi:putative FAD-binding oxidoreductase [Annulohypoxylon maeteangense]|uniref:putative FAD-binding oxidoreductase n=1 Tax=Annulohypoxylon maeteangense TaxID=1927788 RepID=UPI0020082E82|nr:putative FAD-binding oxidoreductase [Annulohypoxylon maeteangense]KAI0884076.1 putative FAD-binding oxidoreductase [Annulohypoxylon maeteangense]